MSVIVPPDSVDAAHDALTEGMVRPLRELVEQLQAENARYRAALERIAGAESGTWGWIAHQALYGKALGR